MPSPDHDTRPELDAAIERLRAFLLHASSAVDRGMEAFEAGLREHLNGIGQAGMEIGLTQFDPGVRDAWPRQSSVACIHTPLPAATYGRCVGLPLRAFCAAVRTFFFQEPCASTVALRTFARSGMFSRSSRQLLPLCRAGRCHRDSAPSQSDSVPETRSAAVGRCRSVSPKPR